MASWTDFAAAEPELADYGWDLLREEHGYAYLATVTRDGMPRVHPVVPFVAEGQLLVLVDETSPKADDLRMRGCYMLHATVGDNDTEFAVRGRAVQIGACAPPAIEERQELNEISVQDGQVLFALDIDRVDAAIWDQGAPRRQVWRSPRST